jgi:hypothetical protein
MADNTNIQEMLRLGPKELEEAIVEVFKADLVPFVQSSPGMGKSDIIRSIAKKFNLKVLDFRLSQSDPTDMSGIPITTNNRTDYAVPAYFPLDTDPVPEGFNGWLLFLDELNSAPLSVQAASYKLILDRAVGAHSLHPAVAIAAAGNLATDKAIVNRQGTAMQSRLVHLELATDSKAWLEWALDAGIDYRIRAFIKFKENMLHKFDPNHGDNTFPCPRTWEFLSRIIKNWETIPKSRLPIIAGTVGKGAAFEFQGFSEIYEELPTIESIIANPENIHFDQYEPSILYAISSLVGHNANKDNLPKLIKFINRLPNEFSVITLREIVKVDKALLKHEVIQNWIKESAQTLI